ncbi:alpha/beta hydrolase [Angustibacter luteus]|uniref:Alpha/beta hydrolase n=1 Tax=Angustibacter luteus TaxID=658456 RepID=A0ABW1J9Q2_9ACTN
MSLPRRTLAFCAAIDRLSGPPLSQKSLAQIRRTRRLQPPHTFPFSLLFGAVPRDVRWHDEQALTRSGSIRVRRYLPTTPYPPGPWGGSSRAQRPLVLYFHGGGWVQGGVSGFDSVCAQVASGVGAVVVSVDYRLAPEHPFPAAVEDAFDATSWAVARAESWQVDPARVAVMGDSAGANLAAVVSQLARDAGGPPIAAQVLAYPGLDGTLSSPSVVALADAPILTRRAIDDFVDRYYPTGDRRDPRFSPLHAPDLSRLPRTLVQTAEYDPLRDDGLRYARALSEAGVAVRYTEYRDVPHGFLSFPGAAACGDAPLREIVRELRDALR